MSKTFTVTTVRKIQIKEGWGVYFIPIWNEEGSRISEVEGGIVRIAPDTVVDIEGTPCVQIAGNMYVPVENFRELDFSWLDRFENTHDLRSRWFATEEEAKEHLDFTLNRWRHPQPWENFVKLD